MREYTIGELGNSTRTKVPTIRYYEQIGLLPEPARTPGNQRRYGENHLQRLAFIRHAREFGFSLEMIRELLSLSDDPDHSCDDVDRIARAHVESVKRRIETLSALQSELERVIRQCKGGTVSDCRIIEVLADHSLCQDHDSSTKVG
jgi:DNA-binding transcriptional MerR regulator